MRVALLAVGFIAGIWIHPHFSRPGAPSPGVFINLAHIRQAAETNGCGRVRVDLRVADHGGSRSGLELVLVCDGAGTELVVPSVVTQTAPPDGLMACRKQSHNSPCFEGL